MWKKYTQEMDSFKMIFMMVISHNEHSLQLLLIPNATHRELPMSCQDTVQSKNIGQDMEYL